MHTPFFLQYNDDAGTSWFQIILLLAFVFLIIGVIRARFAVMEPLSHWHHRFESILFTPEEFYTMLEGVMKNKELSKTSIEPVVYREGGIFSPNRKYLRIRYLNLVFDVCAAPFAKEFFVSWWFGTLIQPGDELLKKIPFFGPLFYTKRPKTFFELDNETMFKETVGVCVKFTIDQLTQEKGMRSLSSADWNEYKMASNPVA